MENTSYKADLRDMEFVLFEHLRMQDILGRGPYTEVTEDDVRMVVQYGADFSSDILAPTNKACDIIGCSWDNGKVTVPDVLVPVWQAISEQGWIGLVAPASVGGQGLPHVICSTIDEMMIAANPAFHTYVGLSRAAVNLLLRFGTESLKETYIPRLLSGEWQGTMCLTEAGAGSDVGASVTRATPVGDGSFKIKGSKVFITAGDHQLTANHIHLVLARLPDAPAAVKGLSLFLVPKLRPDTTGEHNTPNDVFCSKIEEKMGIHGSATTVLNFGDNDNCVGWLVGEAHGGIKAMFHMMNEERIVVGLQGQALAAAMYSNALQYASDRVQGSDISQGKSITETKVNIVNHPDVRRMLMMVKALAEGGRALLYHTALHLDQARVAEDAQQRAFHEGRVALLTPVCKAWGSDTGMEACSQALQVYGGYGFCADYPAEQAMRDARIAAIYEGTNGIQAIDLLFRKVMSAGGKLFQGWAEEIGAWVASHKDTVGLEKEVTALGEALAELVKVTRHLGGQAATDMGLAALGATGYLANFGNVMVGWLMLQQAVIALPHLVGLPSDRDSRRALLEENASMKFYAGKVETTRYFVWQILSQNRWRTAQIFSGDRSALDVCF